MTIGYLAFARCEHLSVLHIDEDSELNSIQSNAFFGIQIQSFISPKKLQTLGTDVFAECKNLQRVELNEGIDNIPSNCFSKSGLVEIRIPESVKTIKYCAFRNCPYLERITITANGTCKVLDVKNLPGECIVPLLNNANIIVGDCAFDRHCETVG